MQIQANGIRLEVDDRGPKTGEPLLLIMGLGMQLIGWTEGLVLELVARGFRVIRFDNRDSGLSQAMDTLGSPNVALNALRFKLGLTLASAYSLSDMARDSVGVLDALGIQRAHVCGASMGGMIAQRVAMLDPERVKSLTLIMTSSGARTLPGPSLHVMATLMRPPPHFKDVDRIVGHLMKLYRLIGSPAFPTQEAVLTEMLQTAVRRSYRPRGTARQLVAVAADGDRSKGLRTVAAPTQIIHGTGDVLVPVAAAHDLAAKIPQAQLDVIEGMGHDLPEPLWGRFASDLASVAERA